MTISLYDATVPSFLQQMRALAGLIAKAEEFCAEKGLPESEIQSAKLANDMMPFPWQVRFGPGHSIKAIEALREGTYLADFSEPPASFAEQRAMLEDAIAKLEVLDRSEVDGFAGRDVVFSIPSADVRLEFTAEDFLLSFSLPNFYFHVTTAYALLRARGVPVGKMDFLGAIRMKAA